MVDYTKFREYLCKRRLQSVSIESYLRDIGQFCDYIEKSGITDVDQVTEQEIGPVLRLYDAKGTGPGKHAA